MAAPRKRSTGSARSTRPVAAPARAPAAPGRPEHWNVDAGAADVATLTVPAVLGRDRVFEVDLRFVVRTPEVAPDGAYESASGSARGGPASGPWLAVTLDLDGAQAWQRRIPAECPGQTDSLDFHCRRVVPEGRSLRLRAVTQVGGGARRQQLRLDAEEVRDDD
jgi:hypothetical protein